MAYYDNIAKQWHESTGYKGGPFKELVLNNVLLKAIPTIKDRSILELGAGNGYFLRMVLQRYSGQVPSSIVITDQSENLLNIAKKHFFIPNAIYRLLDVRRQYPFDDRKFQLILATMVFNEIPSRDLQNALRECYRILSNEGLLLITVIHPAFVNDLQKRGELRKTNEGVLTMPGSGNLRLPVVLRSVEAYKNILAETGFKFEQEEVVPTPDVLNIKQGLRNAKDLPLALVFKCRK